MGSFYDIKSGLGVWIWPNVGAWGEVWDLDFLHQQEGEQAMLILNLV